MYFTLRAELRSKLRASVTRCFVQQRRKVHVVIAQVPLQTACTDPDHLSNLVQITGHALSQALGQHLPNPRGHRAVEQHILMNVPPFSRFQ
jgi:hypothetical protein